MKSADTIRPCPKCGSSFLAWGKPFRSTTPRLIVLLGSRRRIVCCVMCGTERSKQMKAHVEPKSKECPFCGAPTYEIVSVTGMKCVRCTNKRTCGAIVSFNNKDCDERGVSPVEYFNRRAGKR